MYFTKLYCSLKITSSIKVGQAHIPAESVELTVYHITERTCWYLTTSTFIYQYDAVYFIAQFLVDSIYSPCSLLDLHQIWDINQSVISLQDLINSDKKLTTAFRSIPVTSDWNLLGPIKEATNQERETLLHFCGRFGLYCLADYLLNKPGAEACVRLQNKDGFSPVDVAVNCGYQNIAQLFTQSEVCKNLCYIILEVRGLLESLLYYFGGQRFVRIFVILFWRSEVYNYLVLALWHSE
ncbi:hypothetical protein LOTGIDRAFT_157706 [Lottia gigantea]|uniref:Uncharacterized protein n=1 Tax=Lottia gigantea TaxID=225164 RepID=V4AZF1_LOTGI|nr:hypothetical protein LOTGIDRAFT_157706 [Lottia gigantea]ESP00501.1 hypothetical protein LOTGIDRAFT_157706 [Lottia gigantea]